MASDHWGAVWLQARDVHDLREVVDIQRQMIGRLQREDNYQDARQKVRGHRRVTGSTSEPLLQIIAFKSRRRDFTTTWKCGDAMHAVYYMHACTCINTMHIPKLCSTRELSQQFDSTLSQMNQLFRAAARMLARIRNILWIIDPILVVIQNFPYKMTFILIFRPGAFFKMWPSGIKCLHHIVYIILYTLYCTYTSYCIHHIVYIILEILYARRSHFEKEPWPKYQYNIHFVRKVLNNYEDKFNNPNDISNDSTLASVGGDATPMSFFWADVTPFELSYWNFPWLMGHPLHNFC